MVYPDQLNKLEQLIANKETIKTITFEDKKLDELINLKWLLGLIITLLAIEWFIRKRNGDY
ncbi:hypothetical protein D3C79_1057900 [compost metagenome]